MHRVHRASPGGGSVARAERTGERMDTVRAAVVQASSVYYDVEASIRKVRALTAEARAFQDDCLTFVCVNIHPPGRQDYELAVELSAHGSLCPIQGASHTVPQPGAIQGSLGFGAFGVVSEQNTERRQARKIVRVGRASEPGLR